MGAAERAVLQPDDLADGDLLPEQHAGVHRAIRAIELETDCGSVDRVPDERRVHAVVVAVEDGSDLRHREREPVDVRDGGD